MTLPLARLGPMLPNRRREGLAEHNRRQHSQQALHSSLVRHHLACPNTISGGATPHSNCMVVELMYRLLQEQSSAEAAEEIRGLSLALDTLSRMREIRSLVASLVNAMTHKINTCHY